MEIPIINFNGVKKSGLQDEKVSDAVENALSQAGFMLIKDIGISSELLSRVFTGSEMFFNSAEESKNKLAYGAASDNFGYQAVGYESLAPGLPPDLKETLTLRNLPAHVDAAWPSVEFRDLLLEFYDAVVSACFRLQRVIADILQLPADYFTSLHGGENITLRLLHYPSLAPQSKGQLGAGPHTDYGMLTFLFQDDRGGLEVLDRNTGRWQAVEPVADAIVVNTGDLMERWTNGRFKSTLHRVQPRGDNLDRFSIAAFFDPDDDVLVECLPSCQGEDNPAKYPPISTRDHLLEKISATHGAGE